MLVLQVSQSSSIWWLAGRAGVWLQVQILIFVAQHSICEASVGCLLIQSRKITKRVFSNNISKTTQFIDGLVDGRLLQPIRHIPSCPCRPFLRLDRADVLRYLCSVSFGWKNVLQKCQHGPSYPQDGLIYVFQCG